MRAYSSDLRERIVRGREEGISAQELAKRYKVSVRVVDKYWQRYRENGELRARQMGGHLKARLEGHDESLRSWIQAQPDLTLAQLQERCEKELKISLSSSALWYHLEKLGLSFKKNGLRQRTRAS
jgi:transposase